MHPFDAKNQCALILKIIQSPVPAITSDISKPLHRLIVWLLEKDPARRPSVRMLLCEVLCVYVYLLVIHWAYVLTMYSCMQRTVREQMKKQDNMGLTLPAELEDCPLSNVLNPAADVNANGAKSIQQSPNILKKSTATSASTKVLPPRTSSKPSMTTSSSTSDAATVRLRGDRVRGSGQRITSSAVSCF